MSLGTGFSACNCLFDSRNCLLHLWYWVSTINWIGQKGHLQFIGSGRHYFAPVPRGRRKFSPPGQAAHIFGSCSFCARNKRTYGVREGRTHVRRQGNISWKIVQRCQPSLPQSILLATDVNVLQPVATFNCGWQIWTTEGSWPKTSPRSLKLNPHQVEWKSGPLDVRR